MHPEQKKYAFIFPQEWWILLLMVEFILISGQRGTLADIGFWVTGFGILINFLH